MMMLLCREDCKALSHKKKKKKKKKKIDGGFAGVLYVNVLQIHWERGKLLSIMLNNNNNQAQFHYSRVQENYKL